MELAAAPAPAGRPELPPINVVIRPNPNFGLQPGSELLVSAGTGKRYDDMKDWTRLRWGVWRNEQGGVRHLDGGSFDDAVRVAQEIMTANRRDTRWGLFDRLQGRVDALALLQAKQGWDLVRVDMPVDDYMAPVPGAMGPWQKWRVDPQSSIFGDGDVRRERDDVVALVGATRIFDLRGTSPSTPTEPA